MSAITGSICANNCSGCPAVSTPAEMLGALQHNKTELSLEECDGSWARHIKYLSVDLLLAVFDDKKGLIKPYCRLVGGPFEFHTFGPSGGLCCGYS